LCSGKNGKVLSKHLIFKINLAILSTNSTAQYKSGIVGGAGISGKSISGKVGISGKSGKSNVGSSGKEGIVTFISGASGKCNSGKVGKTIGLKLNSNSGKYTVIHAFILCKSIIISGHLGNTIIGTLGTTILISLIKYQSISSLSFLHT
jgi:hypothetical protein